MTAATPTFLENKLFSEFGNRLVEPTIRDFKLPSIVDTTNVFENFTLYKVSRMIFVMGEIPREPRKANDTKGLNEKGWKNQ